ncbi:MAG: DUF1223 domain-containing protein, partial [Gammaproteobacteria bacterium]|nr:DUF1223 domain-containing protein [Gammaproteobacteria bacterium]
LLLMLGLFHLATAGTAQAQSVVFSSSEYQTTVVELFTSEGCSSCPPADRWLSRLKNDPGLWKHIIPLAFHVDYWNYLGWRDPLSNPQYSRRQRHYAQLGHARSVYTPGFFTNGREWRGWFKNPQLGHTAAQQTGTLTVTLDPQALSATYRQSGSTKASQVPLQLHVAVLGFDILSSVTRGENNGKTLHHDFVVLAHYSANPSDQDSQSKPPEEHRWQFKRDSLDLAQEHARALAVWVSQAGDPTPLQATGGWLNPQQLN